MYKSNIALVFFISIIWLYVVMFVAFPIWMVNVFNDSVFLQMFSDIRKTEISSILIEKKTFMVAFLAAFDFVIITFLEVGTFSKSTKKTVITFAIFLAALFMQAFLETKDKSWPYLILVLMILIIKFNSLFSFFIPETIRPTTIRSSTIGPTTIGPTPIVPTTILPTTNNP
jgi:hypothetical protein